MTIEIEAAVLAVPAPERPFAEGRPLSIETLRLDPPKAGEVVVAHRGGEPLPLGPFRHHRHSRLADADRAGP